MSNCLHTYVAQSYGVCMGKNRETCVENFIADMNIQGLLQVTQDSVSLVTKDDQLGFCQHAENIVKNLGNILAKNAYIYSWTIIQNKK